MLTKRIIPCLDVDRGRVVKGVKFFDHVDAGDPVEQARRYQDRGRTSWSFTTSPRAMRVGRSWPIWCAQVMENIFMPLTVGGGIRTLDDATRLIQAGAEKVSLNSAAGEKSETARRNRPQIRRAAPPCWGSTPIACRRMARKSGKFSSTAVASAPAFDVMDWAKKAESLGAGEIVLNVMNADGTTAGYDLEMTAAVSDAVKIPVVASGGAGSPQHILDVFTTATRTPRWPRASFTLISTPWGT